MLAISLFSSLTALFIAHKLRSGACHPPKAKRNLIYFVANQYKIKYSGKVYSLIDIPPSPIRVSKIFIHSASYAFYLNGVVSQ